MVWYGVKGFVVVLEEGVIGYCGWFLRELCDYRVLCCFCCYVKGRWCDEVVFF